MYASVPEHTSEGSLAGVPRLTHDPTEPGGTNAAEFTRARMERAIIIIVLYVVARVPFIRMKL